MRLIELEQSSVDQPLVLLLKVQMLIIIFFVPEQIVSLLVGDKLFLEFEANSNVSETIHRLSTNVNRLLYGVG